MFTIAHLSDIRLGGHPRAAERTERVLRQIVAMSPPPDLILLTGVIAGPAAGPGVRGGPAAAWSPPSR